MGTSETLSRALPKDFLKKVLWNPKNFYINILTLRHSKIKYVSGKGGDVWFGIMVLISPFFKVLVKGHGETPFFKKEFPRIIIYILK